MNEEISKQTSGIWREVNTHGKQMRTEQMVLAAHKHRGEVQIPLHLRASSLCRTTPPKMKKKVTK